MKPSIGRIVHYVLKSGAHRPAIITEINENGSIQLSVFTTYGDVTGQKSSDSVYATINVPEDKTGKKPPFTWHWPEREES